MNSRVKKLRKALNINQENFSKQINISRSHIASIENQKRTLTDRIIADICREFKVNEEWLRTGKGDMFKEDDFYFDLGHYTQHATDLDKALIIEMLKLDEDTKQAMLKYWRNVINKLDE